MPRGVALAEPLNRADGKKQIEAILLDGEVELSPHACEEMAGLEEVMNSASNAEKSRRRAWGRTGTARPTGSTWRPKP